MCLLSSVQATLALHRHHQSVMCILIPLLRHGIRALRLRPHHFAFLLTAHLIPVLFMTWFPHDKAMFPNFRTVAKSNGDSQIFRHAKLKTGDQCLVCLLILSSPSLFPMLLLSFKVCRCTSVLMTLLFLWELTPMLLNCNLLSGQAYNNFKDLLSLPLQPADNNISSLQGSPLRVLGTIVLCLWHIMYFHLKQNFM